MLKLDIKADPSQDDDETGKFVGMDEDGITQMIKDVFVSFDFKHLSYTIIHGNEEVEFKKVSSIFKLRGN